MSDPITSHVLDQLAGQPAGGIEATLSRLQPEGSQTMSQSFAFTATTASDSGRITQWRPAGALESSQDLASVMAELGKSGAGVVTWSLKFAVKEYWKAKNVDSFYPSVEVVFETDLSGDRTHWHVPVLLGPFGYTTYRGT